jgi:hypothetical protein
MPLIVRWMPLHDPLVGCAGAMAPEQFDLNMIERVDIGGDFHRTNFSDSAGPFTSFDPVGFAIFATLREPRH